jgi:hypothetical protein
MQFFGAASRLWPAYERPVRLGFDALLAGNDIGTSTVVVRRAALIEAGCFEPERLVCEDYALWLRLARRGPLALLPDVLCDYRVHAGSLSGGEARLCRAMAELYRDLRRERVLDARRYLAALRNVHHRHRAAAEGERLRLALRYAADAVLGLAAR